LFPSLSARDAGFAILIDEFTLTSMDVANVQNADGIGAHELQLLDIDGCITKCHDLRLFER